MQTSLYVQEMMLKRNFQISNQALNQITNSSQELEEPGSNSVGPFRNMKPYTYIGEKYVLCVLYLLNPMASREDTGTENWFSHWLLTGG